MAKNDTPPVDIDVAQVLSDALRVERRPAPDHLRRGLSEDDDDAN